MAFIDEEREKKKKDLSYMFTYTYIYQDMPFSLMNFQSNHNS